MIKYKARSGSSFGNEEAQEIGELIESLKDNQGHVSSNIILEHAKSEVSPLHKHFEWNETKAAELYNKQQARNIINHIVEVVIVAEKPTMQRSFPSVTVPDKGKVYVTLQDALENPNYKKQLMDKAIQISKNLTITLEMFNTR